MIRKMIALTLALLTLISVFGVSESKFDDNDTIVAMIGDESDFVQAVEEALVKKGFLLEDEADGYFDKYTELAVMNFQMSKDYEANGLLTKRQLYWLDRATYSKWFDTSYIVYITNGGSRYHLWECAALKNALEIMPISVNIAEELGYYPCKRCKPYLY